MDPTTITTLTDILRSTHQLVKYYGHDDALRPELDELTAALQRAIAAFEAKDANERWLPAREANSATRMEKTA
jgi:hypothetical protein